MVNVTLAVWPGLSLTNFWFRLVTGPVGVTGAERVMFSETGPVFVSWMVVVLLPPWETISAAVGLMLMLKSTMVMVICVVRLKAPISPIALTVYVPAVDELHERVAVAVCGLVANVTLEGFRELHVTPVGAVEEREMVPVSPLSHEIVMVELVVLPTATVDGGLAVIVKSE
jgi:hypothetical protein